MSMTPLAPPQRVPLDFDPEHMRTVRCACGGFLTADRRAPTFAVQRHLRTVEHSRWWASARLEWQGDDA